MRKLTTWTSKYFYGNEISADGLKNNYLDYATLAKAFQHVLNNDIMGALESQGYIFDQVSGYIDNSEEIEELQDELYDLEDNISELEREEENANIENKARISEELDELYNKRIELEDDISELEREQNKPKEIAQYYIVTSNGAEILEEVDEIVFYNESLDLYIWGVTHWGTSWDYVPTSVKLELDKD